MGVIFFIGFSLFFWVIDLIVIILLVFCLFFFLFFDEIFFVWRKNFVMFVVLCDFFSCELCLSFLFKVFILVDILLIFKLLEVLFNGVEFWVLILCLFMYFWLDLGVVMCILGLWLFFIGWFILLLFGFLFDVFDIFFFIIDCWWWLWLWNLIFKFCFKFCFNFLLNCLFC